MDLCDNVVTDMNCSAKEADVSVDVHEIECGPDPVFIEYREESWYQKMFAK